MVQIESLFRKIPETDKSLKLVEGRDWLAYESRLGISGEALSGKNVLNIGSGQSDIAKNLLVLLMLRNMLDFNISKDTRLNNLNFLKDNWKEPRIVDLDLQHRPSVNNERNFITGNVMNLPCRDNAFSFVFSLWTSYQFPPDKREIAYNELMRVGKILHIGPIFNNEFKIFEKLSKSNNFDIIACQPFKEIDFMFGSESDYVEYMKKPENERVKAPLRDEPLIDEGFVKVEISSKGGNTIVLKRKENNK